LDKALYDNLSLLGGFEQAENSVIRSQRDKTTGKLGNGQLLSGCGLVQYSATVTFSRQEDKDGTKQTLHQ